jgi:hypothetical protein
MHIRWSVRISILGLFLQTLMARLSGTYGFGRNNEHATYVPIIHILLQAVRKVGKQLQNNIEPLISLGALP